MNSRLTIGLLSVCALVMLRAEVCPAQGRDRLTESDSDVVVRVLPAELPGGSSPSTMLRDSLNREAAKYFARWRENYEARTDRNAIDAYQQKMKQEFISRIGGLPERGPLNAKITGTVERNGYVVEKILLESQPNFFVTAGLFLPDKKKFPPPWPAVVVVCGHAGEGKLQDGYQRGTALAALNGVAGMIVDPVGQGERQQVLTADGRSLKLGPTTEHTLLGTGAILVGWNTARWMINDAMAAVDYLQSRSDIQADRIGCMGNSGGGTQTSYLMALDERIDAAAPSCYITGFEQLLKDIGPQDAEQNIYGQIALGMDHADYLMMRAPKPTLICCGTHDYFNIEGAWSAYRDAKRLFHRFGQGRNIELVEVDDKHGWHPPQRRASVAFMMQHLAGSLDELDDPDVIPLSAEEMNVTPEGQVLLLPGALSAFDHVRQESERLAKVRMSERDSWPVTEAADRLRQRVRETTGIGELVELAQPDVQVHDAVEIDGASFRPLTFKIGDGIYLPALLAHPNDAHSNKQGNSDLTNSGKKPTSKRVSCLMLAEGKQSTVGVGREVQRRVAAGETVLTIDARGVGETLPSGRRWYSQRFGANGGNATLAYLLGQSLVALRAEDCLVVCRWLSQAEGVDSIELVASGELTVPALHAAALHPELVSAIETRRGLTSWSDVASTPLTENQVPGLVHGALRAYDLPDLADLLGERLTVSDPHDATDQPVTR